MLTLSSSFSGLLIVSECLILRALQSIVRGAYEFFPLPDSAHRLEGQPISATDGEYCNVENPEIDAHCEEIRAELLRYGFRSSHESQIALVLDVSGSMQNPNAFFYGADGLLRNGKIQTLLLKALSIAVELSPGPRHQVVIFPFGEVAYDPIMLEEPDIEIATEKVYNAIGRKFSQYTNYHAVVDKMQRYFGVDNQQPYERPPVFVIFATDGEANMMRTEARGIFKRSTEMAMYFLFIAFRGIESQHRQYQAAKQSRAYEEFSQLKEICALKSEMPNRRLLIVDSPEEVSIKLLFKGYRTWLEEAYERHDGKPYQILANDPCIDMDANNPDDREEILEKARMERQHGHSSSSTFRMQSAMQHYQPGLVSGDMRSRASARPRPSAASAARQGEPVSPSLYFGESIAPFGIHEPRQHRASLQDVLLGQDSGSEPTEEASCCCLRFSFRSK
jgi:hypothetical protein